MLKTLLTASTTQQKAPIFGAFFVGFVLLWQAFFGFAFAETVEGRVKHVIDGDTVVLTSGQTVRMVGINTPELGHGKFPDEPLADKARQFLQQQVEGQAVSLVLSKEGQDKYGRLLARLKDSDGEDMQIALLQRGLAYAVAVGNELDGIEQRLAAENAARVDDLGIWGYKHFDALELIRGTPKKRGYVRVIGTVKRISDSRKYKTLWLTDRFRILIPLKSWRKYWRGSAKKLKGQRIEARGWVFKSKGTGGMKVYHPSMAQPL